MSIRALTFDNADNTFAKDHAALFHNLNTNESVGILRDLIDEVSYSVLVNTVNYSTGYLNVLGRLIGVDTGSIELPFAPIGTTEYGYLIIKIDLDQVATNQVSLTTKSQASILPTLVQEDLNNTGETYEFPILSYEITDSNLVSTADVRTFIEKRSNTFTKIAQVGLTDADFSSTDFDSNILLIINSLSNNGKRVANLTTVLATSGTGNAYPNLISSINIRSDFFDTAQLSRIDIELNSAEDNDTVKTSNSRPNLIKIYPNGTNLEYLGIYSTSFQGFKLLTNHYKTLEELGLSDSTFSSADFGYNMDNIYNAMLPYTTLRLNIDNSVLNLSNSIADDIIVNYGTLIVEKAGDDALATSVKFTSSDSEQNFIGIYAGLSWDGWRTVTPVRLLNTPSGVHISSSTSTETILLTSNCDKFNSFKILVGDGAGPSHYVELSSVDMDASTSQLFADRQIGLVDGQIITGHLSIVGAQLIGNASSTRDYGSSTRVYELAAVVFEIWGEIK